MSRKVDVSRGDSKVRYSQPGVAKAESRLLHIENEGWFFKTWMLLMTGGIQASLESRQESSEALSGVRRLQRLELN